MPDIVFHIDTLQDTVSVATFQGRQSIDEVLFVAWIVFMVLFIRWLCVIPKCSQISEVKQ